MKLLNSFHKFIFFRNMSTHKIFVYGTLKKGEPNHNWLHSTGKGFSKFLSKGKTVNKYPLVIASKYNIPFLLYHAGNGKNVIGEIYEVDEEMLANLDILEDHPSFYIREMEEVECLDEEGQSTETASCWIYFLKKFQPSLLEEPFLDEYHSEGSHLKPYTPKEKRIPGYHAKVDVLLS